MTATEAVYCVMDKLGVPYSTMLPAQERFAIDNCRTSGYDIKRFADIISEEVLLDLYDKLIWNYVWSGGPITNSDWGVDSDDKPLPTCIISPLEGPSIKYMYSGIVLSPSNASIISDTRFKDRCKIVSNILNEHCDDIVQMIMSLDATLQLRDNLLGTFLNSKYVLSQI